MSGLVEAATDKVLDRRRLSRQFDRIADRIADQLTPFVESEFSDIPSNEVRAVVLLTEEVLREAQLQADAFATLDGDPRAVEAAVREATAERIEHAHLSDSGRALFDLFLRETTNYLVELAVSLPPFQTAAAQELLRRESLLIERVDEVFQQLPGAPKFLGGTVAGAAASFETEYRRALSRRLDEIELFGLDLPEYRRRYNLDIAYISLLLDLKSEAAEEAPAELCADEAEPVGDDGNPDPPVESSSNHVLDPIPRALITGEAGSGKTTLLQWLAVKACRQELHDQLPSWGDPIPFFIPLRRYADSSLPAPEDFVAAAVPQLAGVMPHGWVHDQLGSGRGLVLVDGLDELPPDRREDVRRWLTELGETFPDSRFIVTSRPPAVEEGWLDEQDFSAIELQPMSYADIASFIAHWHAAATDDPQDEEEVAELKRLSVSLQELIRTESAIRSLATSPLLCAMLCALHRDRKSHLPRGRLEVYRVALEGLIDRRDVEREVATGLPAQSLSLPEKRVLLRDLSHWLMVNRYADAPIERCTDRVEQKLKSMPHLDYSAEQVFAYLLTRSGVLREPVPGRVDFLHRTFQEYLAAAEIVEQDSIGLLVAEAHSDEWREVTILAAGQARRDQRDQLLDGLIKRGESEPVNSHRLHLLAIACLDASVELSEERTEELKGILRELIPPRTITDAIALATAGELAIPLLGASWEGERARTVAACVRSLGLIGGETSLRNLERIAADKRITVGKEIVRMWDQFDPEEYAERVLSKSPMLKDRSLNLSPEKALAAHHLSGLYGLQIGGSQARGPVPGNKLSLQPFARCEDLRGLAVAEIDAEVDLGALPDLPPLEYLALRRCSQLAHLDAIAGQQTIAALELARVTVPNLDFLTGLTSLQELRMLSVSQAELAPIASLAGLKRLEILNPEIRVDRRPLDGLQLEALQLERLALSGMALGNELSWLASQTNLSSLTLAFSPPDLDTLFALPNLKNLELIVPEAEEIESSVESGIRNLAILSRHLVDISAVERCPALRGLDLEGAIGLTDIEPLRNCQELTGLSLARTGVSDISLLAELQALERLDLRNTAVSDFSVLAGLPKLQYLAVGPGAIRAARSQLEGCESLRVSQFARAVPWPDGSRRYFPSLQYFTSR